MPKKTLAVDQMFIMAEQLASDFSLFPKIGKSSADQYIKGLVRVQDINREVELLRRLSVDEYIARTVLPAEDQNRLGAKHVLKSIDGKVLRSIDEGPLQAREMEIDFGDCNRRVGFLAQERTANNGVWMPQHHLRSIQIVREFAEYSIPLVTVIDTPGADAGELANKNNQAHSISRLITEMALLNIPTVAIILGNGYSGGAIPLATANVILSVRDGVYNTIQPRGLASIARKYNLSWQECAKYVGVSAYELYLQGSIDGIIDYVPGEGPTQFANLVNAITTSILSVERSVLEFIPQNSYIMDHYKRTISRYLEPTQQQYMLQKQSSLSLPKNPTAQLNIFGSTYRYLRYLGLRNRIRSTTIERYGRLSDLDTPRGDLDERIEKEHRHAFNQWLQSPLEIKYDTVLSRSWKDYLYFRGRLTEKRGKFARFMLGDPKENYRKSIQDLNFCFAFHLYNLWKTGAQNNFIALIKHLGEGGHKGARDRKKLTVLDVIYRQDVRPKMISECQNLIIFDLVYNNVVNNLKSIAKEAKSYNTISKNTVQTLLDQSTAMAIEQVTAVCRKESIELMSADELNAQFREWLERFVRHNECGSILKSIEEWKKIAFPRISEALFKIVTFFFERLVIQYLATQKQRTKYDGRVELRNIGMKDFWNRLAIAYDDILIQELLTRYKRASRIDSETLITRFFADFEELKGNLMTADPVQFPGFRISIEMALRDKVRPCGIICGIGRFKSKSTRRTVGVVISNLEFQAGAFDMASAEKFCKLLVECAIRKIAVVCFISSGGMQTKEGAGALFSMAIVNDRITRFVRDNDLPVICFGFGDCTGGAQASLATHPLVQSYYFSGANMPFAGQIVVPSYLPATATLSNYLSLTPGSMQGLVKHPFYDKLDDELQEIDPNIPVARETVDDVVSRILKGVLTAEELSEALGTKTVGHLELLRPIKRVLLHARGCTAVKLIRVAQRLGIEIVLVQSDPDMDSVAADMLGPNDRLVCLGGSTSDESYLNAQSVVRIAERENVDALHPGIGFLSENAQFAALCRSHALNFIGPPVYSMEVMGNKSNAINTAIALEVPVVPGSHGIITSAEAGLAVAEKIGYPIMIKAVHGGGGKGIRMVHSSENFHAIFAQMMAEAKSAFGNSDLYIEKCVTSLRHVEVQILRDRFGNTKVLGLRDCSVQRNNQKLVEESGSTVLPDVLRDQAFSYSAAIADTIGYLGAGTIEYMYDLAAQAVYFMEMNTRLQVEHPVTEKVTQLDIVAAQFAVAAGESIEAMKVEPTNYAMEVRINAERIALDGNGSVTFIPEPGRITKFEFPSKPHIDIIAAIAKNKIIPSYYDSMVVQLICTGKNRMDTIKKLLDYLDTVTIQGVCTNIPLLKAILADETFRAGEYDTSFLPKFLARTDTTELIQESEAAAGDTKKKFNLDALRIEDSDELRVLAPSSGIFYITPSPNDPPFVTVGAVISTSATLCLIEAMKLFRPIPLSVFNHDDIVRYDPNKNYEIVRINPTNGQAVNSGDLLFIIKPVLST